MPKHLFEDDVDFLEQLKKSPIHGVEPQGERLINMDLLDTDPTNPGSDPLSQRYKRREKPISESYDILGRFVYPLVVSEKGDGRYWIVDGHGRHDEAKRRKNIKQIRAIVYPRLSLEQRILLRQILNAAQEPFDTPLVLRDLHVLARERKLDIRRDVDLRALLVDLPANIRKHEQKLRLLSKWPAEVADKIGIDDNDEAGVIGYDKVKELDGVVNALNKHHPKTAGQYSGAKLYRQVLKLYFTNVFRNGTRSQEGIRDARRILKNIENDDPAIGDFLKGGLTVTEFESKAEKRPKKKEIDDDADIVSVCKLLNGMLTDVDAHNLTAVERRSLKRTSELISQVLEEVGG